jgi:TonB family protein
VLVATGVSVASLLRLHAPLAALRFWQGVFAAAMLWPAYQLLASTASPADRASSYVLSAIARLQSPFSDAGASGGDAVVAGAALGVIVAGAIIRLLCLALGLMKLRTIRAASRPASSLTAMTQPMQRDLGVAADVRFSDAVTSPATFGAWRPTVLLPVTLAGVRPEVQRAAICHELIHVQRRDWLASVAEELWCALLWFHPAARALTAQLSLAREMVVDQATLAVTCDRRAYAAALLEFSTTPPPLLTAATLVGRRGLERRIASIEKEGPMARTVLTLRLPAALLAMALVIGVITSTVPLGAVFAQPDTVYKAGPGTDVTLPRVIREVKPVYTAQAMQAKIQGTVWLASVVLASGDVGDVTVTKSLDAEYGLDEQAIVAMRQWKFAPGTKDGKAVAVEVAVEFTFTLKK